ncbi:MAG: GNAT family N-acetyltransferase [Caldilineaceae bacterium SB0661_bin_32]|uniref:GNAT family N-acetyltransferase n=1 Tax=Caldilineaceae bacterium SB0661_bin_32 TaxID=2605255 RepID=A0A6B1DD49_9CHLR|nr:GNAT family N-acetyltransferase [Caldilineaceae bacterium SB0661_bin_32]
MANFLNRRKRQSDSRDRVAPPHCPLAIGPLTLTDLESVMELEKVSFPSPWTLATYHSELTRNSRSRYLKVGPAPVPGVRATEAALPSLIAQGGIMLFGAEMHIVTIAVQPAWRGRSVGEWLLLALLALGREEGAHTATLEVRVSNEIALRLYRRAGFEAVGCRRRYYPDKEDARILALTGLHRKRVWEPLRERFEVLSALMGRGVEAPG